jgi:site-specific DNA-methyltransferase (adenine-specific)/modification methylase
MSRVEVLAEDVTLYLGDCREILPSLGKVDAVVTDPPYGINIDYVMASNNGRQDGTALAPKGIYAATGWDAAPPDRATFDLIRKAARYAIIFGGNYFELPVSSCWLVWDKETNGHFADCELAWTNLPHSVRRFRYMWNGMLRAHCEKRYGHPTQKPEGLMKWCIKQLPEDCRTILDPFMGSGTTGVAAVKLGRRFIGIEIEPKYFEISVRRISEALKQPDLFIERPKPPKQEAFL